MGGKIIITASTTITILHSRNIHTNTPTHTHTHSLSLSLSHTHTHSLSLSLSHTHTHTHTHTPRTHRHSMVVVKLYYTVQVGGWLSEKRRQLLCWQGSYLHPYKVAGGGARPSRHAHTHTHTHTHTPDRHDSPFSQRERRAHGALWESGSLRVDANLRAYWKMPMKYWQCYKTRQRKCMLWWDELATGSSG